MQCDDRQESGMMGLPTKEPKDFQQPREIREAFKNPPPVPLEGILLC